MHPILLNLGVVKIYTYGFSLALAFLIGSFIVWYEARKRNFDEEKIFDFILYSLIGGVITGRLVYVLLNWTIFKAHLIDILLFWKVGSLNGIGVIIGAVVVGIFYLRKLRWPIFQTFDLLSLGLVFSQIIERIGFFFSAPILGKETNSFLGVVIGDQKIKRYPLPLFQAIFYLFSYLCLFLYYRRDQKKAKPHPGLLLNVYLVLMALSEFGASFFKDESGEGILPLTLIWPILIMIVAFVVWFLRTGHSFGGLLRWKKKKAGNSVEDLVETVKKNDLIDRIEK